MSKCKSCNADIIWGRTERGKGIPLNPQTSMTGELVYVWTSPSGEIIVRPQTQKDTDSERYENHFQTCADPGKWRKVKRDG